MSNYISLHNHTDMSNPTTVMDSVTSFEKYVDKAKSLNMKSIVFTEHGNVFSWVSKKKYINSNNMKYIHGVEAYITKTLDEKIKDNYHCILIAKNYDGILELNNIISNSYNKDDNHFYYTPRVSYDELKSFSENIIILSACLGGILNSNDNELKNDFINFMSNNSDRCFLEIQHHYNSKDQTEYNKKLNRLSREYGIKLIATGDFHSIDDDHADARLVLQKAKNTHFDNEDEWDTVFKSYDDFVKCFEIQNSIPKDDYLEAIYNTNLIYNMVEDFDFDMSIKYPKIFDDSKKVFQDKIKSNIKEKKINITQELKDRIREEYDVFKNLNQIDFMLLQSHIRDWEKENDIYCGYSRGSVSGSMIAYILGITEIDSMRMNLNFFRFSNPERIGSVADIDTDYYSKDRERVKEFLLKDKLNLSGIQTCNIITFNTIALRGAIRDVGRAFEMDLSEVDEIAKNAENDEDKYRSLYPKLFKYVDLLKGTVVSMGTHAGGVVITDKDYKSLIGICKNSESNYDISCIAMNEIDYLKYVKMDILGLDNVGLINETCKLIGIDRLTPDNTNENDINVWNSIAKDTTLIFQWESKSASEYLSKMLDISLINKVKNKIKDFSYIKWVSFGNGLIRPGCASFRDSVLDGEFYDHGLDEINETFSSTMHFVAMQEDVMMFLNKFCGYSMAESDLVRRGIAKKKGTENLVSEIEDRFIEYSSKKYGITKNKCKEIIKPFLQIVLDAVSYLFSWNHSDAYTWIGYVAGYLRFYYPLEFLTTALNIFDGNKEKTTSIIEYINNKTDIKIQPIKFGGSIDVYNFNKDKRIIYKGLNSIKCLNKSSALELYELSKQKKYNNFLDLLIDIDEKTSLRSNQLDILIKLDYFSNFGKSKKLYNFVKYYELLKNRKAINKDKLVSQVLELPLLTKIKPYCSETDKQFKLNDWVSPLYKILNALNNEDFTINSKIAFQIEYLGYVNTNYDLPNNYFIATNIERKYKNPIVTLKKCRNDDYDTIKIKAKLFDDNPFKIGDIIRIDEVKDEKKWRQIDGEWQMIDETEKILKEYVKIIVETIDKIN